MSRNYTHVFFINFCILLLFTLSFDLINAESIIKSLPGKSLNTKKEISEYLKKNDLTVLLFYYRTESDKSNSVAENIKKVYSKLKYLIDIILINCDNNSMEECTIDDNEDEEEFFKIEVHIPPEYKFNPYTKEINKYQKLLYTKKTTSEKDLYNFITKAIIPRERILTNENYDEFKEISD